MLAKELFAAHGKEYTALKAQIAQIDAKLMTWHKNNELSRRLAEVPAIGPIGACLLAMKVLDPQAFRSGRDFAAWIGLTPKDHSTAGKTRLGVITRAGDETLRSTLVVGATAVIQQAGRARGQASGWPRFSNANHPNSGPVALANTLTALLKRKPPQTRSRRLGQQDRAHRLEADGDRRALQSRA